MLFEMLTGEVPFRGSLSNVAHQIAFDEPPRPRRFRSNVPRELETICLKCLEKDPPRRYATAADLADDLGRFVRGEPIRARPVGPIERAWRWCRRNPLVASLVAAVVLALVGGAATATYLAVEANAALRAATEANRQADHQREMAQRSAYNAQLRGPRNSRCTRLARRLACCTTPSVAPNRCAISPGIIWRASPIGAIAFCGAIPSRFTVSPFHPMANCWPRPARMERCGCGARSTGRSKGF